MGLVHKLTMLNASNLCILATTGNNTTDFINVSGLTVTLNNLDSKSYRACSMKV